MRKYGEKRRKYELFLNRKTLTTVKDILLYKLIHIIYSKTYSILQFSYELMIYSYIDNYSICYPRHIYFLSSSQEQIHLSQEYNTFILFYNHFLILYKHPSIRKKNDIIWWCDYVFALTLQWLRVPICKLRVIIIMIPLSGIKWVSIHKAFIR